MLLLAGVLLGPLVLSFWFAMRGLRRMEIRAAGCLPAFAWERADGRVGTGQSTSPAIGLGLDRGRRIPVRRASGFARPVPARVLFPYVPPGETCRTKYEGLPPVRGRYRFGPVRVVTRFPLGLLRYEKTLERPAVLIVWPQIGRLVPEGLRLQ